MVKLLFLLRDYQLADASKRTRERTLRRWICHCTALCFVSQLHQHTVLCLTAIVLFLTGGSFELVSDSASDRYGTVGKFPLCLVANCVCWFGFVLGPGPVLLLFRCWFLWRNANLAGGFAGRLVSWFLFAFLVVDCFCHLFYCTAGTTAFQSTRFNSFFICLYQLQDRASERHRPNQRKENLATCSAKRTVRLLATAAAIARRPRLLPAYAPTCLEIVSERSLTWSGAKDPAGRRGSGEYGRHQASGCRLSCSTITAIFSEAPARSSSFWFDVAQV